MTNGVAVVKLLIAIIADHGNESLNYGHFKYKCS